jgi:hypothetical protein
VRTGPAHRWASSLLPHCPDVLSASLPCRVGRRSGAPCEHPIDARHWAPPLRRLPLLKPANPFGPIFPHCEERPASPLFPCMVTPSGSLPSLSKPFRIASPSMTSRSTFPCRSSTPPAVGALLCRHPLYHRRGHCRQLCPMSPVL